MRRRLYFLLPDINSTKKAVDELLIARISDKHIHVIADDESQLTNLPKATLLQKSDLIRGMELGLVFGGLTGIIAGIIFSIIPETALLAIEGMVLVSTIAGALIGTWAAGMIAINARNSRLASFENEIKKGSILLIVDIPKARVDETRNMLESHYPDGRSEGIEPTIPAFP